MTALHHRETSQSLGALYSVLRQLYLDLECLSGIGIAPVIRLREARRGCCRNHRPCDIRHGESELSGAFTADIDVHCGIVEFLGELKVPQKWKLCDFRLKLL